MQVDEQAIPADTAAATQVASAVDAVAPAAEAQ